MNRVWCAAIRRACCGLSVAAAVACGAGDSGSGGRVPQAGPPASGRSGGGGLSSGSAGFGNGGTGVAQGGAGAPSTGSGGRGSMECARADLNTSLRTPDILFVIDGSGSMCEQFGGSTRWQALRSALLDPAMGLIYQLQASAWFGMVLYDGTIDDFLALEYTATPGASLSPGCATMYLGMRADGPCPRLIEVPIMVNNAMAIDMAYPAAELGGSTPTDQAMKRAVDLMTGMQNNDPDGDPHPQYIILATDGQPNSICVGDVSPVSDGTAEKQAVIAEVDRARAAGITTFVISTAGTDQNLQAHLEEVADHGNPMNPDARAFSPMNPQELAATLAALLGGAIGCDITLNGKVTLGQECRGTVTFNGTDLPCCMGGGAASCNTGWRMKDTSTVELLGDSCTNFLLATQGMLHATFPCGVFAPE